MKLPALAGRKKQARSGAAERRCISWQLWLSHRRGAAALASVQLRSALSDAVVVASGELSSEELATAALTLADLGPSLLDNASLT